jgi:cation/acetate symporter
MTKMMRILAFFMATLLPAGSALAAGGAVADEFKWMTFAVFGVIIAITMAITFWAARTPIALPSFTPPGRSVTGIMWVLLKAIMPRKRSRLLPPVSLL